MTKVKTKIATHFQGKVLPICSICGEVPAEGICGVMKINRFFICRACENEIINISVESLNYKSIINRMKALINK